MSNCCRKRGPTPGSRRNVLEPYMFEGRRVSSTEIRKLLLGGAVEEAARRLGQHHMIEGRGGSGATGGAAKSAYRPPTWTIRPS